MTVYFENSNGQMRPIATLKEETRDAAMKEIFKFLREHKYESYYQRLWNTLKNGVQMTQVDVGSWSEFFYVFPTIM